MSKFKDSLTDFAFGAGTGITIDLLVPKGDDGSFSNMLRDTILPAAGYFVARYGTVGEKTQKTMSFSIGSVFGQSVVYLVKHL